METIKKRRGNKEDDEIFNNIFPHWSNIIDNYRDYINPKDSTGLKRALERVCRLYNWTIEDFNDYQATLTR